ncbi:MAG: gluconate:H+ symporter [Bacteroidota bacterium]
MPLLYIFLAVVTLLVLVMIFRLNAFIALILVSLGVGIALGMPLLETVNSIKKGVGGTLGSLALIVGFGAMLGALIADSGAAQNITNKLIKQFGIKRIQWAMVLTGFIVGIPIFYTVGFIMLIPIIFAVAASTRLPLLYVGIPMIASLSVTHGFLPPHPAPTAIVDTYGADMNLTLLYGLILAVPTVIIAGPIFGSTLKNIALEAPKDLFPLRDIPEKEMPSFWSSVLTGLVPVILMLASALAKLYLAEESVLYDLLTFVGDPVMAILIAVLVALYTLGLRLGKSMKELMDVCVNSVKAVAIILLIIGAGGAFKQVLIDSGTGDYIADLLRDTNISPLFLAWLIAASLRIALGSATVAALTAAGIALPLIQSTDVSPELLVIATGAGSLTFSQVNDTGFWLFKEYFNLSIGETFRSWTVMETLVSVIGLGGCLLLNMVV